MPPLQLISLPFLTLPVFHNLQKLTKLPLEINFSQHFSLFSLKHNQAVTYLHGDWVSITSHSTHNYHLVISDTSISTQSIALVQTTTMTKSIYIKEHKQPNVRHTIQVQIPRHFWQISVPVSIQNGARQAWWDHWDVNICFAANSIRHVPAKN